MIQGTFLHIAHEEGLISNHSSIHAGIRAPLGSQQTDLDNDAQCGFEIVTARDIDEYGPKGIIKRLKDRVGTGNVYITVDIDVLDPVRATPSPVDEYFEFDLTHFRANRHSHQPLVLRNPVVGRPVSF